MTPTTPATGRGPAHRGRRRRVLRLSAATAGALALAVLVPVAWVQATGQARVRPAVESVDPVDAILVLGAGLRPDGTPSPYLRRRLDAAAELYAAGVADRVVLSGDGQPRPDGTPYDEPASMRAWILGRGVPDSALSLDREGLDTTASCHRTAELTGARTAVVVTQDYHLRRALFSCARAGLDAQGVGVSSASATPRLWVWWHVREVPASWRAAVRELV
ncbi:SanA/YdcF family protein [Krasilnikoviella flava]|uniref:Protein SanA, affects membrane permeability for vancomycin n=1 Tax=Krasilnikoviella flava TaxID=526729 RepID=A0A1T5JDQ1_9MICO|nr:YdcF family protein [Krasilnikoviella flava]SKC49466.1 protein SanA, affects membrane permeability for vancomycin [Krasilnikoviella flava]